jgi:hypothetical protein
MNQSDIARLQGPMNQGMMKIAETHKEMAEKCLRADAENMDGFTQCFKPINKVFNSVQEQMQVKMGFVQMRLDQCLQKDFENKDECLTSATGNVQKIFTLAFEDLNKA